MLYTDTDVTFGSVAVRVRWSMRGSGVDHKPSGELLPDHTSHQQRIGQRLCWTPQKIQPCIRYGSLLLSGMNESRYMC